MGPRTLRAQLWCIQTNCSAYRPGRLKYNNTKVDNWASPPPANFGGGYIELRMDNKPPEPWDFRDTPSKPHYYWNEMVAGDQVHSYIGSYNGGKSAFQDTDARLPL